jgi:hypothetical protein
MEEFSYDFQWMFSNLAFVFVAIAMQVQSDRKEYKSKSLTCDFHWNLCKHSQQNWKHFKTDSSMLLNRPNVDIKIHSLDCFSIKFNCERDTNNIMGYAILYSHILSCLLIWWPCTIYMQDTEYLNSH